MKRSLAILSAVAAVGCQSVPPATDQAAARPPMTNLEYEFAQLRELGCIRPRREDVPATPTRPPPRDAQRSLGDEARMMRPTPDPLPTRAAGPATIATTATSVRRSPAPLSPVQKIGSSYRGPGGSMSRPVGAILLNSDGTTGRRIGNTIFGQ